MNKNIYISYFKMMIFSNLPKSSLLQASLHGRFSNFLNPPESEPHNLDAIPVQRKNVQLSHNEPVADHKIRYVYFET